MVLRLYQQQCQGETMIWKNYELPPAVTKRTDNATVVHRLKAAADEHYPDSMMVMLFTTKKFVHSGFKQLNYTNRNHRVLHVNILLHGTRIYGQPDDPTPPPEGFVLTILRKRNTVMGYLYTKRGVLIDPEMLDFFTHGIPFMRADEIRRHREDCEYNSRVGLGCWCIQ